MMNPAIIHPAITNLMKYIIRKYVIKLRKNINSIFKCYIIDNPSYEVVTLKMADDPAPHVAVPERVIIGELRQYITAMRCYQ